MNLRAEFMHKLASEGKVTCPVCDRTAAISPRPMNATMVSPMLWMLDEFPRHHEEHLLNLIKRTDYEMPDFVRASIAQYQFPKLKHWGLMAKGEKQGFWRVTDKGFRFCCGEISVPKMYLNYHDTPIHWSEEEIDIAEAMWEKTQLYLSLRPQPLPGTTKSQTSLFG